MWRGRSAKSVVSEMKALNRNYGINVFLLTDEYPTCDRDRWEEFLDRLIAADMDVYLLMETRVEDIVRDRDILQKYRRAWRTKLAMLGSSSTTRIRMVSYLTQNCTVR